ncbi:nuclear transport factor 2 family protein [Motiliproteus coralliicola]|uniref:Nuclear transport factor 2 family protein n=2 Tax=Motiliproteus coralliicola TaxID=2283196 RepID=A0A369WG66_9GAMM|nr:nuclear transport factor 2 family protein [Motiliproteus coralliicola]
MTENDVRKMLNQMEQAVLSHDADKLISYLADDAEIILELPANMGGKVTLNVDSYKAMLKQSWAMPANFTYEVRDIEINMGPNGHRATASDVTLETVEMNGQIIASSETVETIEIIYKEGKPLITSIHGKVDLKM